MPTETLKFNESEGKAGFAIRKDCQMVEVTGSKSVQRLPSSKVRVTNVVDYNWDSQPGNGRIMHSHYTGNFIAYSVKVHGVGAVRIVDLHSNDRILMRGVNGLIRDLEFMHKHDEMYLGFIDEVGTVYIHKIKMPTANEKMESQLILQINMEGPPVRMQERRFIWCKYVPDDSGTVMTDYACHFAVCQNDVVYVSNVNQILEKHGEGIHTLEHLKGSFLKIDAHTDVVVDASFAPDGTALATASKDGSVKFFQVYIIGDEPPRCLYSWTPHDGAPVSRIMFLDDHSLSGTTSEGQYWKYMITAGPNFSELKLWTCQSWTCIQTINFVTPMDSARMEVNLNSKFVVLSDFKRKIMYIMHVDEDGEKGAAFKWMNEFSLPCGMLAFNILNAQIVDQPTLVQRGLDHYVAEENTDGGCIVDFILVQPKSLMEASVCFRPPNVHSQTNGRASSRISFDESVSFKDEDEDVGKEELKLKNPSPKSATSNGNQRGITPTRIPSLSPRHKSPSSRDKSPHRRSASPGADSSVSQLSQQLSSLIGVGKGSPGAVASEKNDNGSAHQYVQSVQADTGRVRNDTEEGSISNASSSPSREVEEILSPKNTEQMIPKTDLSYQGLDPPFIINNLDIEGNIVEPEALSYPEITNAHRIPGKTKSLGAGEMLPHLPQVLEQVNSLVDMMKVQQEEMRELKREVSRLTTAKSLTGANEALLNRAVANFDAISQTSLNRVERSIKTSIDQVILDKKQLPSNFTESMTLSLALAVKTEMESRILPQLLKALEPVQSHLSNEVNKAMSSVDKSVKQHMKQFLTSSEFKSSWVPDLTESIKSTTENMMTNVLSSTVIPTFDKTLNAIFLQVNDSFMKGTREYLNNFESASKTDRAGFEQLLKSQLSGMQDALSSIFQVELESQLLQSVNSIQGGLTHQIESLLNRELNKAFKEQQNFLELSIPRSLTPAVSVSDQLAASSPAMDPAVRRAQLLQMIDSGDAPGAFAKAASYGDAKLLIDLARKVNPTEVFVKSLPVNAQLSIIQQLATDMSTNTETRLSYLQTALGTLNLMDSNILRSLARIVPVFQSSVGRFCASNPDSSLIGSIKLLEMTMIGIGFRLQQQQQQQMMPAQTGQRNM